MKTESAAKDNKHVQQKGNTIRLEHIKLYIAGYGLAAYLSNFWNFTHWN